MYLRTWFTLALSLFLTSGGAAPAGFDPGSLFGLDLVTHINVFISLETLTNNLATANFDVQNPLIFPLVINGISSNAGVNGTVFATLRHTTLTHTFNPPLVVNPSQTVNSGNITNVDLIQGAQNSLGIIGSSLNLDSNNVVFGIIPVDGLTQNNVPTSYSLS